MAGTILLGLLILLAWGLVIPKPGLEAQREQTWIRIIFLLILYVYINLTGFGLGYFGLKSLDLPLLTKTESILLAYLLGFGCLSLGVMTLGLAGWLSAETIFLLLAGAGVIALMGLRDVGWLTSTNSLAKAKSRYLIMLQVIIAAGIPLLLLECLSPVWDYDALLYHLEVPRQYLAQGKLYFDPEVLRSAYPYLGEMLFLTGIAFDLDSLAKLINFTYAIIFVVSSYVLSQRFFGNESALTTAGILIGAPAFWMWSTWAGIDFAWASYEFWSVYSVALWLSDGKRNSPKWLMLAGIMSGLALSTKYLSIPSLIIVGGLIVWKSLQDSSRPLKDATSNLFIFGFTAGLVASAWYVKNWVWTGNPVYPLIFGGPGWEPLENQVLNDYVYSFGVGKSWRDFLLLPYNVYAFQDRFSTIGLEVIHPALWLAFLFPFAGKSSRIFNMIFLYASLSFVAWALNSQVIRFLIPLTAFLSILAGAVIETFPILWKNLLRFALIGGFMLFNLIFQVVWLEERGAWTYVSGQTSASQYLQKMNNDFRTIRYIQESLDDKSKVLFLWDGRDYYCDARCVPDDEQSTAVRLAFGSPSPETLANELRKSGFTHLMLSKPDANWFVTYRDPRGLHLKTLDYFTDSFFPSCGRLVHRDQEIYLFEITCQ